MKRSIIPIIIFGFIALFLTSCDKDNYNPPKITLTGKVTYNGEPIGVRGTDRQVQMQLWQDGYDLYEPIEVYIDQEGSFTAKVFKGEYKLVSRDNHGPWVNNRDTVFVNVKGNMEVDYPVTPYYILSNVNITSSGNIVTATFDIDQITAGKNIESIHLYVNRTQFVDQDNKKIDVTDPSLTTGSHTLTADMSSFTKPNEQIMYARIGVKIAGVNHTLYSTGAVKVRG
ncbi:DUF3823 domain-containing protein [Dysgonomonas sp. 25]|uniref:DUF3823 domain-containing protein n=1 Tax=Dysgonomonas sp. 25 TaxID=2302933 RepID=UPI0013D28DA8|nr:DUF3823 domain-containing protein [Dysgonomonas sp. 25]